MHLRNFVKDLNRLPSDPSIWPIMLWHTIVVRSGVCQSIVKQRGNSMAYVRINMFDFKSEEDLRKTTVDMHRTL